MRLLYLELLPKKPQHTQQNMRVHVQFRQNVTAAHRHLISSRLSRRTASNRHASTHPHSMNERGDQKQTRKIGHINTLSIMIAASQKTGRVQVWAARRGRGKNLYSAILVLVTDPTADRWLESVAIAFHHAKPTPRTNKQQRKHSPQTSRYIPAPKNATK